MPFWRDSATFSAACRQTEQERNSASPSFHSLDCLSKVRGVDAIRKLATAAPEGVKRSSGSSTRLPTTVMTVSPAMCVSWNYLSWTVVGSVGVGPDDLGAQHRLVQRELTVELLDGRRLGLQVHHGVDAFGVLVDLVGETTTAPDFDVVDGAPVVANDVEVRVERGLNGALLEVGIEDDHEFIGTHSVLHLLRTQAATAFPWQEG